MMTSARGMIAPFDPVARELFDELTGWPIFDPHSHIDPHRPAARNLNEILGYHYYTELAHATGMPADRVGPGLDPRTRSLHLAEYLERIDNTVQYSWLMEIARTFNVFTHDRIDPQTIGDLYDRALRDRERHAHEQCDDSGHGPKTSAVRTRQSKGTDHKANPTVLLGNFTR